ncbi:DUF916 domain-containing protein [Protaetiibacter larvae]|uniref:DUF916 domain-containing protein n=1 Tax=Protaetiibacter larvae TaxID=2592654 RepID=A0A5C1YBE6_9MICO|nr:DUF916 domain-containing protein [Protaetiibacter larvae]
MLTPTSSARAIRRVLASLALLATALLVLAPGSAYAADGDDEAGVSLRPAEPSGAFDGRTNFRYAVDPGQTVQDYAAVVNTGSEPQDFTIIGTDAFNDENGDFALLPTDDAPELVGRWISFENGENRITVTLQPGEGRLIPFTLALPADATPGDHVGGIVASVFTAQGQVQVDRRVAIRLYARVSGDLQPALTINSLNASYNGDWWNLLSGTVTVEYTVTNPGNVALAANVEGGVKTWFGIPVAKQTSSAIKEILPGNSASYAFELPRIAQLLYLNPYVSIVPFVDSDDVSSYVPAAPTSRDTALFVAPWLVLIGLAVAGLVVALVLRRRRRENARAIEWMEQTEKRVREEALAAPEGMREKETSRGA